MRTLVRAVGAVVIVAAIGFVLARAGGGSGSGSGSASSPLSGRAATGAFRVSYPADWRRLSTPPAGLVPALSGALALAPKGTGQELVIGTASTGDSSAGQLPAALRSAVASPPRAQLVNLGGQHFYRYLDLAPHGQGVTESVYQLATTAGTIGAVCAAQRPSASFTAGCERVLATLRLTAGRVLAAGVDEGYALSLNAIVAKLNAARSASGLALRRGSLRARARAAQLLAAAHARAAASVGRLSPAGGGLATANRLLGRALGQTAGAYRALGRAITDRRQAAYQAAEGHIEASARTLGTAFTRLRGLGYRIG